jgi:chromosome segregation ATPase
MSTRLTTHVLNRWADSQMEKRAVEARHADCSDYGSCGSSADRIQSPDVERLGAENAGLRDEIRRHSSIIQDYEKSMEDMRSESIDLKTKLETLASQLQARDEEVATMAERIRVCDRASQHPFSLANSPLGASGND